MTDRTSTPWELIEATEHHGAYVVNSWGRTVCDLYAMSNPMAASVRNGGTSFPVPFDDMAANAAFIVKAVNSHDALVKALEGLLGSSLAVNQWLTNWDVPFADESEWHGDRDLLADARNEAARVLSVVGTVNKTEGPQ